MTEDLTTSFCDSKVHTHNHYALQSWYCVNRYLLTVVCLMSLLVLVSNRAMSLSSWHNLWNRSWVWWHLAAITIQDNFRKGIKNLFYPSVSIWRKSGPMGEIKGNLFKRLEFRKQTAFLVWYCQNITHNLFFSASEI